MAALGNVIEDEYVVRGNKVYEGGATYPVSYAYDLFNVMANMTTYSDAGLEVGRAVPREPQNQGDTTKNIMHEG